MTEKEIEMMNEATLRRKADQHWEMAGLARHDMPDAERHTALAKRYEKELKKDCNQKMKGSCMKQKVCIIDLDNCISDDSHRLHLINHESIVDIDERYKAYHNEAMKDELHNSHILNVKAMIYVVFTARPYYMLEKTSRWLHEKGVNVSRIFMREAGDHRSSKEVKEDFLKRLRSIYEHLPVDSFLAYDDKPDVVEMYRKNGIEAHVLSIRNVESGFVVCEEKAKFKKDAGMILDEMADTFRERNSIYGDNYKMVGKLMAVLFPNGISKELLHSDQFHLFELKLVKLSRFAISNLMHQDSIHDDGVYSAMIESIIEQQKGAANE